MVKYLTKTEIEALLRVLKRRTRDEIFFELLLKTGARPQELLNLTPLSLNVDENTVFIKGLKRSNDREIPIERSLMKCLIELANENVRRLFPVSYAWMRKAWQEYTPNRCKTMKACRHSMGTHGLERSRNIKAVQKVLGHKRLSSTEVYADIIDSKKNIKKVVNGLY